ncbi:cold-regulated 413 plasma membrane protein 4 isoform X2 [Cannabis sativa]|uniref:cold-regulated 413 plasma membrane protein 4 isoform X2 n=1 Tax=Cannabis sativa TaxID=3483 RepID=UPI0011DF795C|nr:cold-regulated 413 plasma membrane protein 4 isoform X2 [Cannabis sativa]
MEMGFTDLVSYLSDSEKGFSFSHSRTTFQWGGTLCALGGFGYWVSFLAVAAHLFFPEDIPVSRFILFVITPDYVAKGLRETSAGNIFCLIIGILLVLTTFKGGRVRQLNFCETENGCHLFCYVCCLVLLLLFTIFPWN